MSYDSKIFMLFIGLLLSLFPEIAFAAAECINGSPKGFTKSGGIIQNNPGDCELGLANLISGTICLVQSIIAQSSFNVYCTLLEAWQPIIQRALELYVIFYAIAFLFGIGGNHSLGDATARFIKVSIIYLLISTPDYFYFWIYEMFMNTLDWLSLVIMDITNETDWKGDPRELFNDDGSRKGVLDFIDVIFFKILDPARAASVIGIAIFLVIVTGGLGSSIFMFIMIGIGTLIIAFVRIILTYITAMMALTFLMMFSPIFLTSLLFKKTEFLFNAWFGSIVSYSLQPPMILAFLFVIGQVLSVETLINGILGGGQMVSPGDPGYQPHHFDFFGIFKFDFMLPNVIDPLGLILSGGLLTYIINIMGFILAWIILNFIAIGFIDKLPELARELAKFKNVRAAIVGGASRTLGELRKEAKTAQSGQSVGGMSTVEGVGRSVYNVARGGVQEYEQHIHKGMDEEDRKKTRLGKFDKTISEGIEAGIKGGEFKRGKPLTPGEKKRRKEAEEKAKEEFTIEKERRQRESKEAEERRKKKEKEDKKKAQEEEAKKKAAAGDPTGDYYNAFNAMKSGNLDDAARLATVAAAKYPDDKRFEQLMADIETERKKKNQ